MALRQHPQAHADKVKCEAFLRTSPAPRTVWVGATDCIQGGRCPKGKPVPSKVHTVWVEIDAFWRVHGAHTARMGFASSLQAFSNVC